MGYTHYWKQTRDFADTEWADIRAMFSLLCKYSDVKIDVIKNDHDGIQFNGSWYDQHEDFYIARKVLTHEYHSYNQFCKTQQKPYDEIVVALLWYLNKFSNLEVTSDGCIFDQTSPDALDALNLMAKISKYNKYPSNKYSNTILPLTNFNTDQAMAVVWQALHGFREDSIPANQSIYDEQWDEICTAMAWIGDELEYQID